MISGNAAPLLFKKIERVEAAMFLFFLTLMLQALIEREVRHKMKQKKIESLDIYPEFRDAFHPTTSKILYNFEGVSISKIKIGNKVIEEYKDELSSTQKVILDFLDMNTEGYWDRNN